MGLHKHVKNMGPVKLRRERTPEKLGYSPRKWVKDMKRRMFLVKELEREFKHKKIGMMQA